MNALLQEKNRRFRINKICLLIDFPHEDDDMVIETLVDMSVPVFGVGELG